MDEIIDKRARRGRGAVDNPPVRFDRETRVAIDDGWGSAMDADLDGAGVSETNEDEAPRIETTIMSDASRSAIAWNDSPDIGFDRSVNPYRGCEHGCVYCFARPSHAYLGMSPGLDFETKLVVKFDVATLLEKELRNPRYTCQVMAMGTNTDPYQPIERKYELTRRVLEVLSRYDHPVAIVTKSDLVTRDIDILAPMAKKHLARVLVSVTTLDRSLARTLEPRASTPGRRLKAIEMLADAGIPAGVMIGPVIPALTDHEIEAILTVAREKGATSASHVMLRLPHEVKDLMADWLDAHAPGRKEHVLSLVRQMRGGKLNDPRFGNRFNPSGPYAQMVQLRFRQAVKRLGYESGERDRRRALDITLFHRPPQPGDQLSLL